MMKSSAQNWWQLTSIQVGIIICLPAIMVGHVLYNHMGLTGALLGLIGGSLILWALALLSLRLCLKKPIVIIEMAEDYMGIKGQYLCGLAFALSLCGWFAIQLNLMSQTVYAFLQTIMAIQFLTPWMITIILGLFITAIALKGIKAIGWFANATLPLMILTLSYAIMMIYQKEPLLLQGSWSMTPIALMISSKLAGVVNLPTYYRFARSSSDAYISISLVYLFFLPLIGGVGLALAVFAPQLTLIEAITQSGGLFWEAWAVFFLVIAGWTTNNGNLFSSAMALKPLSQNRVSDVSLILILGILGSCLGCLNILQNFQVILSGMGILVGSMGSMIWTQFLINKFEVPKLTIVEKKINLIVVILSSILGFCSLFLFISLTGFAFLDAMLASFIGTLMGREVYKKWQNL